VAVRSHRHLYVDPPVADFFSSLLGRKNHFGSRSERGTEVAALFYSIIESAKLAGVEPDAYLRGAVRQAIRGERIALPHELAAS
jgi:hypothetical protein